MSDSLRAASAAADDQLVKAASAVFADEAYQSVDWNMIAVVFNFAGGRKNCYGYYFKADGEWEALLPRDPGNLILKGMLNLRKTMAQDTGRTWHRALMQIARSGEMNTAFEYDDPERWTIRPDDLDASVEALRRR